MVYLNCLFIRIEVERKCFEKMERKISDKTRKIVLIASIVLILIVFTLIGFFVGMPLVEQFQTDREGFRDYVQQQGVLGPLLMIGVTIMQVVIALVPGEPFELAAGFIFGWIPGSLWCMIGTAIASTCIFSLVRVFGRKVVELFFQEDKIRQYAFLQNEKRLGILVFILFMIPGTPKDLLTYIVPLTPMKLGRFLWISLVAKIPSLISSTITGHLAQEENWTAALITYGVTIIISGILILWYRRSEKQITGAKEETV